MDVYPVVKQESADEVAHARIVISVDHAYWLMGIGFRHGASG
jgi:hypothetical protein